MGDPLLFTTEFNEFYSYWKGLRDDDSFLPKRARLKPQDLTKFLDRVSIIEITGEAEAIVRISGTSVDKFLGKNLTGLNLFDFYKKNEIQKYIVFFEEVLSGPYGVLSYRKVVTGPNNQKRMNSIALPMANKEGKASFLFVFYELETQPNRSLFSENPSFSTLDDFDYKLFDLGTGKFKK